MPLKVTWLFFFFFKSSIFMSNTQENVTARNWGGDFVFSSVFLFSLSVALCSLSLETVTLLPPVLSACSVVVYRRDYLESCRTTLLKCSNEDKEWYLKTVNWLSRICQGKQNPLEKKQICVRFLFPKSFGDSSEESVESSEGLVAVKSQNT